VATGAATPKPNGQSPGKKAGKNADGSSDSTGDGSGSSKGKPGGTGTGVGGGHGAGHEGGGATESSFGWYHVMLHDRFYARWDQPLSLLQGGETFTTLIKIKIDRAGHVSDVSLAKSSGNATVDDSVLTAAQRVSQVDPLPKGLGNANGYEVNIEFKLSP